MQEVADNMQFFACIKSVTPLSARHIRVSAYILTLASNLHINLYSYI